MRSAAHVRILFSVTAVFLGSASALAQPAEAVESEHEARARFEEGLGRADDDDWAGAAEHFRLSLALRPSPVVTYNLASALVHIGETPEARTQLTALLGTRDLDPRIEASARALLDRLDAERGTVHVQITLPVVPRVQVDGEAVETDLGFDLHLAPGAHRIDVEGVALEAEVTAGAISTLSVPAPLAPVDETPLHFGIAFGVAGGALVASLAFVIGLLVAGAP